MTLVHSGAKSAVIPTEGHDTSGLDRWMVEEIANYQGYPDMVGARIISECDIVAEIAGAVVCGDWGRHQIHTARAHLIAAAPDLLEACREVIDFVQHDGNTEHDDLVLEDVLNTVRAAIRKATAAVEAGSVGTPQGVNQNNAEGKA